MDNHAKDTTSSSVDTNDDSSTAISTSKKTFCRKKKYSHLVTAIFTGALMTLAMAPFHYYPLALISIFGCYWLFERSAKVGVSIAKTGWFYGLGFWGAGVSWIYVSISDYGYTPGFASPFLFFIFVAFIALFHALQGWCYSAFKTHHRALSFAVIWVVFEWLRQWLLNGFPWLYVGYAYNNTALSSIAPIFGVYGISIIVVLTAMLPAFIKRYAMWAPAPIIFSVWVIAYWLQNATWTTPQDNVSVALVQGNIAQEQKWEQSQLMNTLNTYDRLSSAHWDADITLWPEAAIPMFFTDMKPFIKKEQEHIITEKTTLIAGIPYDIFTDGKREFYNGIISLSPNISVYKKQKLVPFGEYIPLSDALKTIAPFIPIEDFQAGDRHQQPLTYRFDQTELGKIGTFICFETAYPNVVARLARNSDMLATVSNDAWFGNSHGPHQHLQIAQMRALENEKYIIRSTNNGITTIIDQRGKIVDALDQNIEGVLRGEATRHLGMTPFSRWGNVPIITILLISLLLLSKQKPLHALRRRQIVN